MFLWQWESDASGTDKGRLMAEPRMPDEIIAFMDEQMWGIHHAVWHGSRLWDFLLAPGRKYITDHGGSQAPRQEGAAGNGLDFLAMHRVMLTMLKQKFPVRLELFQGWEQVPVDPDDKNDPVPQNHQFDRPFSDIKLKAKEAIENQITTFKDDDELGLFIQTALRPTADEPRRQSPDARSGIHGYLHDRFSDSTSDIKMQDFFVNIKNRRFWRLHGWIDSRWSFYRKSRGLSENDPVYAAALKEQWDHMMFYEMPVHDMSLGPMPIGTYDAVPDEVRNLFSRVNALSMQR